MPFAGIIGQESAIAVLRRSLKQGKVAQAYLFDGIGGCGKKTAALAFVEAVFCGKDEGCGLCSSCRKIAALQHPDLHLVEPDGTFIKIDQIRGLQRELAYRPFEAPKKACIIDAADRLNPAAGNALLKTLEEPPGDALMILVTDHIGGMLPTIISRCQRLHFSALSQAAIEEFLRRNGSSEEESRIAASLAGGSLSKAMEKSGEGALTERTSFLETAFSLTLGDIAPLFAAAEALAADKEKALEMLELLLIFLRDMLLLKGGNGEIVNHDLLPLVERQAARISPERTMERIRQVVQTRQAIQRNVNARLALEVLFMRLAEQ